MPELFVADLMTEKVVFGRENDSLESIYDAMMDNKIRHLPILNSEGEILGIISHRDLVGAALYNESKLPISQVKEFLRNTRADEVMTRGVEVTEPMESLSEAGLKLLENQFGCLPVVEGLKLIGILTEADFVRYLCEQEKVLGQRLGSQAKVG
jgi:CBS domain-containing membrane protein